MENQLIAIFVLFFICSQPREKLGFGPIHFVSYVGTWASFNLANIVPLNPATVMILNKVTEPNEQHDTHYTFKFGRQTLTSL